MVIRTGSTYMPQLRQHDLYQMPLKLQNRKHFLGPIIVGPTYILALTT